MGLQASRAILGVECVEDSKMEFASDAMRRAVATATYGPGIITGTSLIKPGFKLAIDFVHGDSRTTYENIFRGVSGRDQRCLIEYVMKHTLDSQLAEGFTEAAILVSRGELFTSVRVVGIQPCDVERIVGLVKFSFSSKELSVTSSGDTLRIEVPTSWHR